MADKNSMVNTNPHDGQTMAHIGDLKPDPQNARVHNPRNVGQIERSIESDGFGRPGLLARDNSIIAGNATAEAAANVGMEDVLVIDSDGTKPIYIRRTDVEPGSERFRKLALSDNRAAELATWSSEVLASFVDEGLDLEQFWFPEELAEVLNDSDEPPGFHSADLDNDSAGGYREQYGVIVVCEDEAHQERVFRELQGNGHNVRVVVT